MKIKKILNNNVALSLDNCGNEIIVMGKGIAYGKKTNDGIDPNAITKIFVLNSMQYPQRLIGFGVDISPEQWEITDQIIRYAKTKLSIDFHDTLYISILDHLHASVERYKEGVILTNKLLWEIKNFYPKEYEIGLYGLELIKKQLNIDMQTDEAGFIALHIVSAQTDDDLHQTYELTHFIQSVTNIVKYYFKLEYDIESLAYHRFTTHLKFFSRRLFSQVTRENSADNNHPCLENDLLNIIKGKYVQPYLCSLKIKQYIQERYQYVLDNDEILYLTIHIAKISEDKTYSHRSSRR